MKVNTNNFQQKPIVEERSALKKSDRGFQKEFERTQKKSLKRKEDDVASQESPKNQQSESSKKSESANAHQKKQGREANSLSVSAATSSVNSQASVAENVEVENVAVETPTRNILNENTGTTDVLNLENPTVPGAGGIDVSEMELVTPKAAPEFSTLDLLSLNAAINKSPEVQLESDASTMTAAEDVGEVQFAGIDSIIGKKESDLKDSSSEEQNLAESLGDLRQDNLALHSKEKTNEHFHKILETKSAESAQVQQKDNVDSLVSNVRTIIKDGGGEMVMKLTPEGLGTIDLKVGVESGVVNIEMMADTADAKKAIEDHISDIRVALEGHNLKIDTMKVDISDTFKDMQQNQNMMEQQFARNFLGQYRDERQALRQQSLGMDLERFPTTNNGPQGLNPAQARPMANGRLNVVA